LKKNLKFWEEHLPHVEFAYNRARARAKKVESLGCRCQDNSNCTNH